MSRVANDATAFAHCDKQAMVMVTHFGPLSAYSTDLHARTLDMSHPEICAEGLS